MPSIVIARSSQHDQYFTATSAYDSPRWVSITEATVYKQREAADLAVRLLRRRASEFSSELVMLDEIAKLADNSAGIDPSTQVSDKSVSADEDEEPDEDEEDTSDIQEGTTVRVGKPKNPIADKTEVKQQKVDTLKFNDPAIVDQGEVNLDDSKKVVTPSYVKTELTKIASDFGKKAESGVYDNDTASFYLTVQAAAESIVDCFDGSVDGLKRAQVVFASLMSPIQFEFPENIRKYLLSGGKPRTMKDMMKDIKAVNESETYTTYKEWVKACKQLGSNVQISGGAEGAEAVDWDGKGNPSVGEWNGKTGTACCEGRQKLKEGSGQLAKSKVKNYINGRIASAAKTSKSDTATPTHKKQASAEAKFYLKQKRALKNKTKVANFGDLEQGRNLGLVSFREFVDTDGSYASVDEARKDLQALRREYTSAKANGVDDDTIGAIKREFKRISDIIQQMVSSGDNSSI